jgi:FMN phosphatase YigB (HAD superfamily)
MAGFRRRPHEIEGRVHYCPALQWEHRVDPEHGETRGPALDAILGAEVVHAYKPAPEVYLRTADVLAMEPEQICLVAAHNGDLAAARKCGMRTAFIPRPTEHGPNQTTDLRADQDWDVIAADIGDLAEKLVVKI